MNFERYNIEKIIPLGVLSGSIGGIKIVASITGKNGESYFAFLLPPSYDLEEKIEEYIVDASMAKYGYQPVSKEYIIRTEEELKTFILEYQSKPYNKKDANIF